MRAHILENLCSLVWVLRWTGNITLRSQKISYLLNLDIMLSVAGSSLYPLWCGLIFMVLKYVRAVYYVGYSKKYLAQNIESGEVLQNMAASFPMLQASISFYITKVANKYNVCLMMSGYRSLRIPAAPGTLQASCWLNFFLSLFHSPHELWLT